MRLGLRLRLVDYYTSERFSKSMFSYVSYMTAQSRNVVYFILTSFVSFLYFLSNRVLAGTTWLSSF